MFERSRKIAMNTSTPSTFEQLRLDGCIEVAHILKTADGFFLANRDLATILAQKGIYDFLDSQGDRLACNRFFDDWFLYAVPNGNAYTYSLLKLREQEHDTKDGAPADGDTPGVTIAFIAFDCGALLECLADPTDENRSRLNREINRVVALRGQNHHDVLKAYFKDPRSEGAYLVAEVYTRRIAALAKNGTLEVPEAYKKTVQRSVSYKSAEKWSRLPSFIEELNRVAGHTVCDNERIFVSDRESPTGLECAAILATHTGNTSVYSFAAEVEYHARFLTPLAKIKIPFFGRSVYDSAIRADMTVDVGEFEGPAPFYRSDSEIVERQRELHRDRAFVKR